MTQTKNDTIRRIAGLLLIATGIGAMGWVTLVICDVLFTWWAYRTSSRFIAGSGIDQNLAKVLGVIFTVIALSLTHNLISQILMRKRSVWVVQLAAVGMLFFSVQYALNYEYSGAPFNIFSAQPQFKYYRNTNGRIVKMPTDAKSGPEGQTLQFFDNATAEEFAKQEAPEVPTEPTKPVVEKTEPIQKTVSVPEKKANDQGFLASLASVFHPEVSAEPEPRFYYRSSRFFGRYWLSLDQIVHCFPRVYLQFSAHSYYGGQIELVIPAELEKPYLADDSGTIYRSQLDTMDGDVYVNFKGHPSRRGIRTIVPGEIFRFVFSYSDEVLKKSDIRLFNHNLDVDGPISLDPFLKKVVPCVTQTAPA